jgi:hypothetical protein
MSRVSNLALYISAKKIHIVIHYDGQIQKELEQIVGDIASARNKIRKGYHSKFPFQFFCFSTPNF